MQKWELVEDVESDELEKAGYIRCATMQINFLHKPVLFVERRRINGATK
jgi:hypothetical protein